MEAIVEKIKKLLSLAQSDNENEAKIASAKAQELMVRYNLQMKDIPKDQKKMTTEEMSKKYASTEDKFVNSILNEYFFVIVVTSRRNGVSKIHILGQEANVEIAYYMHAFLTGALKGSFQSYKKETGCKEGARQSFYMGMYDGIKEQLEAKRQHVQSEMGMVVVKDPDIRDYMALQIGKTSQRSSYVNKKHEDAHNSGIERGKDLRISKGIESSAGNTGLYIK